MGKILVTGEKKMERREEQGSLKRKREKLGR